MCIWKINPARAAILLSTVWIILCVVNVRPASGDTDTFRIAALFEPKHEGLVLAMQNAVTKVNMRQLVGRGRNLLVDLEYVDSDKSFDANRKVCRQMRGKIAGIFGPISESSRGYVQSLSQTFLIPHIDAVYDARVPREYFSVNVYPDHEVLSGAFADLIKYFRWTDFTIVYEDNTSLVRLSRVFEAARGEGYHMSVRQLETFQGSYRTMLKEIKDKHQYRLIIDCDIDKVEDILEQADSLNMVSSYFHFHFTTLDLSTLDLDKFQHKGANITSMRLITPSNPEVMNLMAEWNLMETNIGRSPMLGKRAIRTDTALMYDAVHLYARAILEASHSRQLDTQELNCNKPEVPWTEGDSLMNVIRASSYSGLSGLIRFEDGRRKEFDLEVTSLVPRGLIRIGTWDRRRGINITLSQQQQRLDDLERLRNTTLRVVTIFDPPYAIKLDEPNENGMMVEGFIIDLLDELSARLGFNYTIYEQAEKKYGSEDPTTRKWDGMVGDLIDRDSENKADLAAAGLTITYERASVVDFTMPFLNLGITIIYKKPVKSTPELFSFLSPLSLDVWIYMIAAYLCVSLMLFVIARFTPYEWENPHPCDQESEAVENQFNILNSLWFTIGSLMQQGCDIMPKAVSTRMVAVLWWFFTLILISSYTANLAAFLTVSRMDALVSNAEDLSKQTEIAYGTLLSGSTRNFFKTIALKCFHSDSNTFSTVQRSALGKVVSLRVFLVMWSDIAPKAGSSRFVASVWYLFTLIIVSSYTANLAAFLTVRRMDSPIKNAEDLSLQTDIKYGTLLEGSTRQFFKNSNMSVYKRMNSFMTANEATVMVSGNAEGFERVKNSNYAFLAESTSIDYQVQRNCDLTQVGDLLDNKGYGLASPKDAYWLPYLSREIVHLQQKQVISKIYNKWWVEMSGTVCPEDDSNKVNNNALGVANVGGVFVVLAGGSCFAFLVAILEFIWKVGRNARKDGQSFGSELSEELKFIFRCKSTRHLGKEPSQDRVDNGVRYSPANTRTIDAKHRES